MQEEQYWVQVDGDSPYTTNDSARLWAMLFGLMIGVGVDGMTARMRATSLVDSAVKEQGSRVEELKDGRILRVSVVHPGEVDK